MKHKRTDVPTSITETIIKGVRYTVKIYDEAAYKANIAQYYGEPDENTPARSETPRQSPHTARRYKKRKPQARYNWVSTRIHLQPQAGVEPEQNIKGIG